MTRFIFAVFLLCTGCLLSRKTVQQIRIVGEILYEEKNGYPRPFLSPPSEVQNILSMWVHSETNGNKYGLVLIDTTNLVRVIENMGFNVMKTQNFSFLERQYNIDTWPFFEDWYEPRRDYFVVVGPLTPEQLAKLKQSKQ